MTVSQAFLSQIYFKFVRLKLEAMDRLWETLNKNKILTDRDRAPAVRNDY